MSKQDKIKIKRKNPPYFVWQAGTCWWWRGPVDLHQFLDAKKSHHLMPFRIQKFPKKNTRGIPRKPSMFRDFPVINQLFLGVFGVGIFHFVSNLNFNQLLGYPPGNHQKGWKVWSPLKDVLKKRGCLCMSMRICINTNKQTNQ